LKPDDENIKSYIMDESKNYDRVEKPTKSLARITCGIYDCINSIQLQFINAEGNYS